MSYHEKLASAIQQSGLSLRKISEKCTDGGCNVSQSYLSQLCTGDAKPASDKVNEILGKVLSEYSNMTSEELIVAAYKERIPPQILEKLVCK